MIDAVSRGEGVCLTARAAKLHTEQGRDRYGRTVGRVACAGTPANEEQVRRGMAWVYDRYAAKNSPLYVVQTEARREKRGLRDRKINPGPPPLRLIAMTPPRVWQAWPSPHNAAYVISQAVL